ncbi:MAG TPA: single-stranded DNA-binding protein [Candidatus Dwaynia gallinarum]|nr:single-stranded DNA-binding protein [Candidatus Dwaynia gallinarum]
MKEEGLKIKGNLVDEVKSHLFTGKNGEVKVYNFTLVKKYGNGKEYINCSFYGDKIDKLKKGDLVYVFGSFSERRKEDKIYKNFIVKEVKKI